MYQIFPDRFCEGNPGKEMPFADRIYRADKTGEPYFWPTEQSEGYLNMDYYGGDFAGIQQKLPYLRDLGITCLYLNPIFEAHANHRYNTANYLKADPLLGTNEEFSALCAATPARTRSTSTARAATARAVPTATAARPTAAGTTLTPATAAATAAGGALRHCLRCRRIRPPMWILSAARAASLTLGWGLVPLASGSMWPMSCLTALSKKSVLPSKPTARTSCCWARSGRTPRRRRPSASAAPICAGTASTL